MEQSAPTFGPTVFSIMSGGSSLAAIYLGIVLRLDSAVPLALLGHALLFGMLAQLHDHHQKIERLRSIPAWVIGALAGVASAASITAASLDTTGQSGPLLPILVALATGSLVLLFGMTIMGGISTFRQMNRRPEH